MGSDQDIESDLNEIDIRSVQTFDIESIVPEIEFEPRPKSVGSLDQTDNDPIPVIVEAKDVQRIPDSKFGPLPGDEPAEQPVCAQIIEEGANLDDLVSLISKVAEAIRTGNPGNLTASEIKSVTSLPGFSAMIGGRSKSIDQIRDDYLKEAERNLQIRKKMLDDPMTSSKTKLAILKDMDDRAGLTPTRRVEQISFRMNKDQAEFVGKVLKETGK